MGRSDTTTFLRDAKAYAKRSGIKLQTLSRKLFDDNPYGLERLDAAMKSGKKPGPPHTRVLDAMERFAALLAAEEDEEREAAPCR